MKKALLIIVWIFGGIYCYAQDLKMEEILEENCLPKVKLNGNIKQIQTTMFNYDTQMPGVEKGFGDGFFYRVFFFDKNSKVVKIKNYSENHRVSAVTRCHYNKNGMLAKKRDYGYRIFRLDRDFFYDDNNRVKSDISFRRFTDNYIYDENGRLVKIVSYDKKRFDGVETYKYDGKGQKIEECKFDKNTVLEKKIIYSYDANGNKNEERTYNSKGQLTRVEVYKYDAKGNEIENIEYNSSNEISGRIERTYNVKGNEIECKWYGLDDRLELRRKYWYDSHNNIYKEEHYRYHKDGNYSLEENIYSIKYRK